MLRPTPPPVRGKLGLDSRPLPTPTNSFFPSRETATAVGYQPVGMKPRTRLSAVLETSITATSLLSAFVTNSRVPSGESANALGVLPVGALGNSDVRIVSWTVLSPASITLTELPPEFATNSRLPSGEKSSATGCRPTAITPAGTNVAALNTETDASPWSAT